MGKRVWDCKIGECDDADLHTKDGKYYGADGPMRAAVKRAYREVTGRDADFVFSGWAGKLDDEERIVVDAARAKRD